MLKPGDVFAVNMSDKVESVDRWPLMTVIAVNYGHVGRTALGERSHHATIFFLVAGPRVVELDFSVLRNYVKVIEA